MNQEPEDRKEGVMDVKSQQIQVLSDRALTEVLGAWHVETADISGQVFSTIGTAVDPMIDLLLELRGLREEIRELRRTTAELHDELARMREESLRRAVTRIAPFTASEQRIRLS